MRLTIKDRIGIGAMMPREASLDDMLMAQDITRKVTVTDAERTRAGYKRNDADGTATWDDGVVVVDISFNRAELRFMKSRVAELSTKKKIQIISARVAATIRDEKEEQNGCEA